MRLLGEGSIVIQGHRCLPCQAVILSRRPEIPPRDPPIRVRKEIPDTWIQITLTEGKNRQVRRMTASIGHPTLRLIRIAIGRLTDSSLAPGAWKKLDGNKQELAELGESR
jgi:23S rRNA pseudouridine2457 synthase